MLGIIRLITCIFLLVTMSGCSRSTDPDTSTDSLQPTREQSVTERDLFDTSTTRIAPDVSATITPEGSTTPDSTPDPLAFDDSGVEVIGYQAPTNPDAAGCVAARSLLLDPAFQQSDARAREDALIEATSDVLAGAEDAWFAIRDVAVAESEDFETRAADMTTAFESANHLNQTTWETCGVPILDVDDLISTGCTVAIACEPATWADSLPCFELERFTVEIGPDVTFDQENYRPIDCATAERIELDQGGAWQRQVTLEERARLVSVWIIETEIAAGTSAAQALEDDQIIQTTVDRDLDDPMAIIDPSFELQGLVAARDLPVGQILVAGDFIAP